MEIFLQWTPTLDGVDVSHTDHMIIMWLSAESHMIYIQIINEPFDMFAKGAAAEIPTIIVSAILSNITT